MRTVRLPLLRGALFIIALAAISILLARGDNPAAEATSFEPFSSVRVSDPSPGANADIIVDFSLNEPDSYPNLTNKPAIQFIPRQWGIDPNGPIGGMSGTFNTLTYVGIFGNGPCAARIPVDFTMFDSTPDTGYDPATGTYDPEKLSSSLDLGGDSHPLGAGFSGQFVDDLNFATYPSDHGNTLVGFNADEKWAGSWWSRSANVYRDAQASGTAGYGVVSARDVRLQMSPAFMSAHPRLGPGTEVATGDPDEAVGYWEKQLYAFSPWSGHKHDEVVEANAVMDPGEHVYSDRWGDGAGVVSDGDRRLFEFEGQAYGSIVDVSALTGGITRYPDFLNRMFHPEVIGNPLARQFGQSRVLWNPVSLNLVTFRPGQLPGYPASLGYPTVVVVLNPLDLTRDPMFINMTNDLCTPLSLTSTNFGLSRDNPETPLVDESGHARLTNPGKAKDHVFTLVVESQPDADDDGVENLLDTCPLDVNLNDDSREDPGEGMPFPNPRSPDDHLDGACDTLQFPPGDWGAALAPFNPDEKIARSWGYRWGSDPIYRDKDATGRVSVNDDRLYHVSLPPGKVQFGDSDIGRWLTSFPANPSWDNDYRHSENVAANGRYDPGEDMYLDRDHSGDVGFDDHFSDARIRFEGSAFGGNSGSWKEVSYIGTSAGAPSVFVGTIDEDQDNYSDRGDNCSVVKNGVEVLGRQRISLRAVDFFVTLRGNVIGPDEQLDTDGDGIGDACEGSEHGSQCLNDTDDDDDNVVNDGCPTDHPNERTGNPIWETTYGFGESVISGGNFGWCQDTADNDGDGRVNDGCPEFPGEGNGEFGGQCDNDTDEDGDGRINDGCPYVRIGGTPETGDQCDNALDEDADGRPNDGCPSVDPGDLAKTTVTGHVHTFSIQRPVKIAKHGIKLNNLAGPQKVKDNGARTYSVDVSNLSGSDSEDVQVALRVVQGCATVNGAPGQNTAVVSLSPGESGTADFTVDWTNCLPGLDPDPYVLKADACHAGDAAPAGFFGSGACPGTSDGMTDPNALDDVYMTLDVEVGSTP